MRKEPVSVCMATYNGRKYIKQQIMSILEQLESNDELIVVDDYSTDDTVDIIKDFNSPIIKIHQNSSNLGYVKTFEKALSLAKNSLICLSDQDDIWIENRLQNLCKIIREENVLLIASNFEVNNESQSNVNFLKLKTENSKKTLGNIKRIFLGKSAYYGCTMIIDRRLLKFILPFPKYLEAHDLWIAIVANMLKSVYHVSDNTVIYRVHQNNTSLKKRSLMKKIITRYYFCKTIISTLKRLNN